jgi:hypothetical protein
MVGVDASKTVVIKQLKARPVCVSLTVEACDVCIKIARKAENTPPICV